MNRIEFIAQKHIHTSNSNIANDSTNKKKLNKFYDKEFRPKLNAHRMLPIIGLSVPHMY